VPSSAPMIVASRPCFLSADSRGAGMMAPSPPRAAFSFLA
jgi:hypothetical protein